VSLRQEGRGGRALFDQKTMEATNRREQQGEKRRKHHSQREEEKTGDGEDDRRAEITLGHKGRGKERRGKGDVVTIKLS